MDSHIHLVKVTLVFRKVSLPHILRKGLYFFHQTRSKRIFPLIYLSLGVLYNYGVAIFRAVALRCFFAMI